MWYAEGLPKHHNTVVRTSYDALTFILYAEQVTSCQAAIGIYRKLFRNLVLILAVALLTFARLFNEAVNDDLEAANKRLGGRYYHGAGGGHGQSRRAYSGEQKKTFYIDKKTDFVVRAGLNENTPPLKKSGTGLDHALFIRQQDLDLVSPAALGKYNKNKIPLIFIKIMPGYDLDDMADKLQAIAPATGYPAGKHGTTPGH